MTGDGVKSVIYLSTHPAGGGAAVACSNLYAAMQASMIESDIISLDLDGHIQDKLVYFSNVALDRLIRKLFFRSNPIFHSSGLYGVLKANSNRMKDYDVIHAHWISNGLIGLGQLARTTDPLVITMHDSWFASGFEHHPNDYKFSNTRFDQYLFRKKQKVLMNCAGLIFPSAWQLKVFQSRFEKLPMCRVIPNIVAISQDKYSLCADETRSTNHFIIGVCCQRAFENPAKGSIQLKELLKHLNEKYRDGSVALYIAGKGSRNIEEIRAKFPRILIRELGVLAHSKISSFYRSIDLYLNLSTIENLSTTLIESLGYSIPSVALDVGGNSEIVVNGETGLLIDDNTSLNEAVCGLIENPGLLLLFKKNSNSRYLTHFSPDVVLSAHLDFYRKVKR